MDWWLNGFFGYGRLDAPIWLLGMEEHCFGDADIARRLPVLPTLRVAEDLAHTCEQFGFAAPPNDVPVWDRADALAIACGLGVGAGRAHGHVLLTELLPLPRHCNGENNWPAPYRRFFPDYRSYEKALLRPRAARFASMAVVHRPRLVVVHGARYHAEVREALHAEGFVAEPPRISLQRQKPVDVLCRGGRRVLMVHNFGGAAGWSANGLSLLSEFVGLLWHGGAPSDWTVTHHPSA